MERESLRHGSKGGRFREIFVVGPKKDKVAKIPHSTIEKKYAFGTLNMPGAAYALLKFGNLNINRAEYENYRKLPDGVRDVFTPKCRLIKGVLIEERVFDYDGTPSLSIDEHIARHGFVRDPHFWDHIERVKQELLDEKCYLLGVFYGGSNIMVQRDSADSSRPMIVDFKRLGRRSYPAQPHLWSDAALEQKFLRQYDRFIARFKPTLPSETRERASEESV